MALEPMHAAKYTDITKKKGKLIYPCFVQPKIDGIRGVIVDGKAVSRTWKPLPNVFVQNWVTACGSLLHKFDGELVVGDPCAPDVYRKSMSGIMSEGGTPDFKYLVFDIVDTMYNQAERFNYLLSAEHVIMCSDNPSHAILRRRLVFVETRTVENEEELMAFEAEMLALGYEGICTRRLTGKYKHGRATPVSQELVKMKRFTDEEAEIIGFEELCSNQNEATINAYGRTARSSHKENKVPQDTLGAFVVRNQRGTTYNVGMGQGLDMALRKQVWDNRGTYLGRWITVRYVTVGGYDKPRFPGYHGFRELGT